MYYLIGIKGADMSALASLLKDLGYEVKGSDSDNRQFTEEFLKEKEIEILPFSKDNIKEDMYIIKGENIKDDNIEVEKAKELNIKISTYEDMISKLTTMFQTIAVAGCHGKTQTSSKLAYVLDNIKGTNYLVGDGSGHGSKEDKYFVLEACEYKRNFLKYHPYYAIITSIDYDHSDYYKTIDEVINAYQDFADNAEKMVIACGDDQYTHSLEVSKPIFYYGLDDDNDIIAKDVNYSEDGIAFDVFIEDNYYGHFDLPIYGKHMLLDTLAVISFCYYERIEAKEVNKLLKNYKGAKRIFNETKVLDNIIIDDNAHHPNEVKATIKSINQKYPNKDIIIIFEPHTYSKTEIFKEDYIQILSKLKKTYILNIKENNEDYQKIVTELSKKIPNAEVITENETDKIETYQNSVIAFLSANDLTDLEKKYINKYENI